MWIDILLSWIIFKFSIIIDEFSHSLTEGTRNLPCEAMAHSPQVGYPPHCTHALQGLDVVCFARMKEAWKQVINEFETVHWAQVTKGDFTSLFGHVYCHAFTKETIEAAFK